MTYGSGILSELAKVRLEEGQFSDVVAPGSGDMSHCYLAMTTETHVCFMREAEMAEFIPAPPSLFYIFFAAGFAAGFATGVPTCKRAIHLPPRLAQMLVCLSESTFGSAGFTR